MSDHTESHTSVRELDIKLSDGSNYPEWAEMLTVYLALHNLEEIVNGTIKKPVQATRASESPKTIKNDPEKWQRANVKARAFMIANTTGNARSTIQMECDAHTAWEELWAQYEGKTRTNLIAVTARGTGIVHE